MKHNNNEIIRNRYNRIAVVYDIMDRMIKEQWRKDLLLQVSGKVLEVGIGTGANLPFYPSTIQSLTGVDFSKGMLNYAREKTEKNIYEFPIELVEADIQKLPFPDHSFDSIVSTCVFCSVPDPLWGLKELKRVCKPSGRIYMLEHMRSEIRLVGTIMDLLNPLTVRLWGANINRNTLENINLSGLSIVSEAYLMSSIMRSLIVSK